MLTVVAFKVKFTDSKGNVKDYDVTGQEEGTLLDAIKGAGIPIQSFFTVIDPSVDRWKLHLWNLCCVDVPCTERSNSYDCEGKWSAPSQRKGERVPVSEVSQV